MATVSNQGPATTKTWTAIPEDRLKLCAGRGVGQVCVLPLYGGRNDVSFALQ